MTILTSMYIFFIYSEKAPIRPLYVVESTSIAAPMNLIVAFSEYYATSMSQLSHTGEGEPSITMTRAQCWQANGITLPAAPADSAA